MAENHVHVWGPLERSHFAGTVHRNCQIEGCSFINALDDDPHEFMASTEVEDHPQPDENVCGWCGVMKEHHPQYTEAELEEMYGE